MRRKKEFDELRELTLELGRDISDGGCGDSLKFVEYLLDNINIYSEIVDKNGCLIYASPKTKKLAKKLTGKEPIIGGSCWKQISGLDERCPHCMINEALNSNCPIKSNVTFPDGSKYKIKAIPLFDNGNSAVLLIGKHLRE